MEKTITLFVAILTALGVGGWSFLRWILSRKEDKRMSAAKAMAQEMETLMRNYSAMEKKIDKLEQKVDNLYKTVHQLPCHGYFDRMFFIICYRFCPHIRSYKSGIYSDRSWRYGCSSGKRRRNIRSCRSYKSD